MTDSLQRPILVIHTDGGARGNPGPAAAAFVALGHKREIIYKNGSYLGETTNNFAEYSAVANAIHWIVKNINHNNFPTIVFNIDSLLVVNQLNGKFKIKNKELLAINNRIKSLEKQLPSSILYQYVPRSQNSVADLLVNQTLDHQLLHKGH